MNKVNVKKYTTKQLLDEMSSLESFTHFPKGFHIIVVRSNEDATDIYDDKLYLFKHKTFQRGMVMPCTTHSGKWGLLNFWRYNKNGVATIKSNEVYYDSFLKTDGRKVRHHKGLYQALRLVKKIKYFRDKNKDLKIDEKGKVYYANFSTNIHSNSHYKKEGLWSWIIGKWSLGCIVINDLTKYWKLLNKIPYNHYVTLTVLKEF